MKLYAKKGDAVAMIITGNKTEYSEGAGVAWHGILCLVSRAPGLPNDLLVQLKVLAGFEAKVSIGLGKASTSSFGGVASCCEVAKVNNLCLQTAQCGPGQGGGALELHESEMGSGAVQI